MGLNELLQNMTFKIYLNPANNNVRIEVENENLKSIKNYDTLGQFLQEYSTNDFSISDLSQEIYFLLK